VETGDRFRAVLGCLDEQEGCAVVFQLNILVDGEPPQNLGSWRETDDGVLSQPDLDLSSLAGKSVQFQFTVHAAGPAGGDAAVWAQPRIVR
jgi:hypothetical protein